MVKINANMSSPVFNHLVKSSSSISDKVGITWKQTIQSSFATVRKNLRPFSESPTPTGLLFVIGLVALTILGLFFLFRNKKNDEKKETRPRSVSAPPAFQIPASPTTTPLNSTNSNQSKRFSVETLENGDKSNNENIKIDDATNSNSSTSPNNSISTNKKVSSKKKKIVDSQKEVKTSNGTFKEKEVVLFKYSKYNNNEPLKNGIFEEYVPNLKICKINIGNGSILISPDRLYKVTKPELSTFGKGAEVMIDYPSSDALKNKKAKILSVQNGKYYVKFEDKNLNRLFGKIGFQINHIKKL
jgi:hypothetical protein